MKRVYVNEEVCIGCGLCEVYCRVQQSQSKDLIKAFKKEIPRPVPRVRVERNVEISFPIQCRQCSEPWCVYCCLTGAMHRDPVSGMIGIEIEKCIGCWTCIVACPYGALTRDLTSKTIIKCNLCPELEIPACVVNCPNEALIYAEPQTESHNVES